MAQVYPKIMQGDRMKYKTIVIDPAWDLVLCTDKLPHSTLTDSLPYKTMTDEQILNFDIEKFADDDCNLFLWTTKTKIHTAFHIIDQWGFKYDSTMVWNKGDGINYNGIHNIVEFIILAHRGKSLLNYRKPLDMCFYAKRLRHSEKPAKFYAMLRERTQEPRIDIFARKRHYGFDAYGDEVETKMDVPLKLFVGGKET